MMTAAGRSDRFLSPSSSGELDPKVSAWEFDMYVQLPDIFRQECGCSRAEFNELLAHVTGAATTACSGG